MTALRRGHSPFGGSVRCRFALRLLDDFARYERAVTGLADATVTNHRTYLDAFLAWWTTARPHADLLQATTTDLADFLVHEAERGLAPRTRRGQIAALRRWYDWLVLTGRADVNPATALGTPRAAPSAPEVYRPTRSHASSPTPARSPGCAAASGTPSPRRCAGPACAPARHTFATELVRAGVDIHVVQRLLGHASIASTVGYTHLSLDDIADAVGDVWASSSTWPRG